MMKLRILAVFAAALAATAPTVSARQHAPYSGIVVFGTSLSDSGNAFALRGGTNTPPDYDLSPLLVPNAPYMRGGHHFSNGATWIEQFARALGLAGTVRPAYGSDSPIATNYAVGAARACEAPGDENVNLADQVAAFLTDSGGCSVRRVVRDRDGRQRRARCHRGGAGRPPARRVVLPGHAGGGTDSRVRTAGDPERDRDAAAGWRAALPRLDGAESRADAGGPLARAGCDAGGVVALHDVQPRCCCRRFTRSIRRPKTSTSRCSMHSRCCSRSPRTRQTSG